MDEPSKENLGSPSASASAKQSAAMSSSVSVDRRCGSVGDPGFLQRHGCPWQQQCTRNFRTKSRPGRGSVPSSSLSLAISAAEIPRSCPSLSTHTFRRWFSAQCSPRPTRRTCGTSGPGTFPGFSYTRQAIFTSRGKHLTRRDTLIASAAISSRNPTPYGGESSAKCRRELEE